MATATLLETNRQASLEDAIRTRSARCGVLGLGYVGLPLALELTSAGFQVTGVDPDQRKADLIRSGRSPITDCDSETLSRAVDSQRFAPTTDFSTLGSLDAVSICVPTPLRKTREPDLTYVMEATRQIAKHLHPGMLIILESTTYPGTTEEVVLPTLEETGMTAGEDFYLCFSPERVDPGNQQFVTRNIPKVIGGVTKRCAEMGALLYSQIIDKVIPVSSSRSAEMVKLLENTFRMINIGLANEMAMMCHRMNIDVWEVIDAASTKPFGFMPFYPGPGLGGHCIPVDPYYLSWKMRQTGSEARFIELAGQVNRSMPHFVVERVQENLNHRAKPVKGSRVHLIGVSYKRDVSDVRESPALDIIQVLRDKGAVVSYSDPFVPRLATDEWELKAEPLESVRQADSVVIVTDHTTVDYAYLVEASEWILDTRNVFGGANHVNVQAL